MADTIRLLIADDHTIMREGLKQLFAMAGGIVVADEAVNGSQAMEKLRQAEINLLLLDMNMPGVCGEDLVARVRLEHPALPILVLSMHNEPQIAQRALKAGAAGYVTKDSDPATLLAAIQRVAGGGRFIDPELAEQMAFEATGLVPASRHQCLSDREFQVLRLFANGMTVNQIAEQLTISNKTVSTHKARLMEKMGFSSNAELVRYAVEHGLA